MSDRPRYRWLILVMAVIVNMVPAGLAWTYVALIASPMVSDLGRGFESWGLPLCFVFSGVLRARSRERPD